MCTCTKIQIVDSDVMLCLGLSIYLSAGWIGRLDRPAADVLAGSILTPRSTLSGKLVDQGSNYAAYAVYAVYSTRLLGCHPS